jgi:hypothetical protein
LQPALKKYDAHRLHFYGALIELAGYTAVNEYAAALKVCERYIQFFLRACLKILFCQSGYAV